MNTRLVCSFSVSLLLKKKLSSGMSPRMGTLFLSFFWISP